MLYASLDRPNPDRPRSKSRTPAKIQRWAAVSSAKSISSPPRIPEAETGSSLGNVALATFSIPMRRSPSTTRQTEVSSPSPRTHPRTTRQERRDELNGFRLSEQKEEDTVEEVNENFRRQSLEDIETPDSQRSQNGGGSKLPPTPVCRIASAEDYDQQRRPSQTSNGLTKTPRRRCSIDHTAPPSPLPSSPSNEQAYDSELLPPPIALPISSPVMEPAPTMTEDSPPTPVGPRPKSRLHHEISECCEQLRATSKEFQRRNSACERVSALIFDLWADVEVHLVGSTATHLFLSDSDIDIVVRAPKGCQELTMADLMQLGQHLERYATHLQVVSTASVPIIKMVDSVTKFTLDITLNISTGLYSTALIMQYLDDFAPLKPLILVLKQLLKIHSLNELYRGGIPSYTLGLMIVSFLQFHTDNQKKAFNPAGDLQPGIESERHGEFEDFIRQTERAHARRAPSCSDDDSDSETRDMEEWEGYEDEMSDDEEPVVYRMNWQTDYDVGNLLLSFLELYGKSFDYTKHGITCKDGGGYFPKRTRKWWHPHDPTLLCLENPVDPTVDLGFKIYHIDRVRKLFASVLDHLSPDPSTGRTPCELRHLLQLPGSSLGSPGYSPAAPDRRLSRSHASSPGESTLATPMSAIPSSPDSLADGNGRTFSLDNTHNTHQKYNLPPALPSSPVPPKMAIAHSSSSSSNNKASQKSTRGRSSRGGRGPEPRSRTESSNSLQNGRGSDRKNSVNSNSSTQSGGGWRADQRYSSSSRSQQGTRSTTPRFSAQASNPRNDVEKDRRGSAQNTPSHSSSSSSSSSSGSSSSSHHSSHHSSEPVAPTVVLHRPAAESPRANGMKSFSHTAKQAALSIQLPTQPKQSQSVSRPISSNPPPSKPIVTVATRPTSSSRPQASVSPKKQQQQQPKPKPRSEPKRESKKTSKTYTYETKK